jgi:endo-1,4-beta-mannosidase
MAGAPTKYREEYNEQAYKLCLLGATDAELADFFEVNPDTVYEWKKNYKEFSESVTRGKKAADAEVANSFFNRAKGFEVDSEKIFQYDGTIIRAETKTYYPPDAGAALNWLKNRQPEKWRDKQEVVNTNLNYNIAVTPEEAAAYKKAFENEL